MERTSGGSRSRNRNGSNAGSINSEHKNNQDDVDWEKKRTMTGWKRRLYLKACVGCVCVVSVVLLAALTSRGYHRRHKRRYGLMQRARLRRQQAEVWKTFLTQQQRHSQQPPSTKATRLRYKDEYLEQKPAVALAWHDYLAAYPHAAELFADEADDQNGSVVLTPNTDDKASSSSSSALWDETAEGLGAAAERVGDWMHSSAQDLLGREVAHSVGTSVHEAVVAAGEWTDQQITDAAATLDSVTEWMAGSSAGEGSLSESWSNWTQGFFRAPATLWNLTMDQLAAFDDVDQSEAGDDGSDLVHTSTTAAPLPNILTRASDQASSRKNKFAFVTHGFPLQADATWRFETYVLGALQTFLKGSVLFYVVNTAATDLIQSTCQAATANKDTQEACRRLIPIYVQCPTRDYGVASCCHQDKGLAIIAAQYPQFDWYLYYQDDLYFRLDYLGDFVQGLPNPNTHALLLSPSPFRAHGSLLPMPPYTMDSMAAQAKKPLHETNCSSAPNHIYPWGRPVLVYSHAALQRVAPSYRAMAITNECAAFRVPAEAASPIVHWMHQLPVAQFPPIASRTPNNLASRLVPLADDDKADPLAKGRAQAQMRVIGTPRLMQRFIAFRAELGLSNFTELHQEIQTAQKRSRQAEPLYPKGPYQYQYHRPKGYTQTTHYQEFGSVRNWTHEGRWHTFRPKHCITREQTPGANMLGAFGTPWPMDRHRNALSSKSGKST